MYTLDFSLAMQHILPVFSKPIVFAPRRMLSWQVGVGRGTCPIRNRSVVYTNYENFIATCSTKNVNVQGPSDDIMQSEVTMHAISKTLTSL